MSFIDKVIGQVAKGRGGFGIVRPQMFDQRGGARISPTTMNPGTLYDVNENIDTPQGDEDVNVETLVAERPQADSILARTLAEIAGIQNKTYEKGHGGIKDILKSAGLSALEGLGKGDPRGGFAAQLGAATGAAIGGGVRGGIDKSFDDRFIDQKKLEPLYRDAILQGKIVDEERNRKYKDVQIEGARLKPILDQAKLDQRQQEIQAKQAMSMLNYERLVRAEEGKNQRAGNQTKIQEVDGYLFRTYPNDAKKEMEPIIDPRTGKQAFNPANVAQEITFADGTKAFAKGGQIVAGKFAGERQAKQQEFTAGENEKDRQVRRQEFLSNFQLHVANTLRQIGADQQHAGQWRMEQIKKIQNDVKANKLDQETANQMLAVLQ